MIMMVLPSVYEHDADHEERGNYETKEKLMKTERYQDERNNQKKNILG